MDVGEISSKDIKNIGAKHAQAQCHSSVIVSLALSVFRRVAPGACESRVQRTRL